MAKKKENPSPENVEEKKEHKETSARKEKAEHKENAAQEKKTVDKEARAERKRMRRKRKKLSPDSLFHQAMPIILLALCAFFGICIYTGIAMGILGGAVHNVSLGLLGMGAFFLPPMLLLWSIRWQRAVEKQTHVKELVFGFLILMLISVLWYAFGVSEEQMKDFGAFYRMGMAKVGGGVLGNAVGFVLVTLVSKVGTVLIAILLLILFGVFAFGFNPKVLLTAFLDGMRARVAARHETIRRKAEEEAENTAERKNARFRGDKSLYVVPEAAPTATPVKKTKSTESKGGRDPFMVPGEKKNAQTVVRRFFDVETETALIENETGEAVNALPEADSRQQQALIYDDDSFFNDAVPAHGESARNITAVENSHEEALGGGTEKSESETVTVASDTEGDIPDIPAYQIREEDASVGVVRRAEKAYRDTDAQAVKEENEEREELFFDETVFGEAQAKSRARSHASENAAGETDNHSSAAAGQDPEAADEFVINKAHVIEHIGAETVGGGERIFSGRQDTFFHSFPPLSLLQEDTQVSQEDSDQEIKEKSDKLMETLSNYGVRAQKSCASRGPRLTRYELIPDKGVRIRAIESLVDEIAMNLEAISVRIEAPIPGKAAVGVEVPNVKYSSVRLRGLLDTDTFRDAPGKTTVCLGVDVIGVPVFADLEKMPHLLVAGATGMGKSVCINSILVSLLYKARPDEIKLILIDPKKVEFKSYASIPHLLVPVVTEAQKAAGALSWAVGEMERRYDIIERVGVRNIKAYNKTLADHPEREPLPQIVIVIDELHDLMIQAKDAVEDSIARIAAKARAAGILLIIGTQRPSVNVITGVIKANIPSRIAFHVASQVDSRTILDATGAEKLLNNGDMLFLCPGMQMMTPKRVQGAFLDDDEVNRVAEYLRKNSAGVQYNEAIMADMDRESEKYNKDKKSGGDFPVGEAGGDVGNEEDMLYRAIEVALENDKISTSLLQRKLSVGFGKAARMIDRMEEMGIVGPPNGQKAREILISMDEYRAMRLKNDE